MQRFLLFTLFTILVHYSCNKQNLRNAEDSLEGTWQVVEVFTGTNNAGVQRETGDLGQFTFMEDNLEYNFTRRDTVHRGEENWELTREKENVGFSRV